MLQYLHDMFLYVDLSAFTRTWRLRSFVFGFGGY